MKLKTVSSYVPLAATQPITSQVMHAENWLEEAKRRLLEGQGELKSVCAQYDMRIQRLNERHRVSAKADPRALLLGARPRRPGGGNARNLT